MIKCEPLTFELASNNGKCRLVGEAMGMLIGRDIALTNRVARSHSISRSLEADLNLIVT